MSAASLSLYNIEADILKLLVIREALVENDDDLTDAEQKEAITQVDLQLKEQISSSLRLKKIDSVAYYLREFQDRADVINNEINRLKDRLRLEEARHDRLEEYTLGIMKATGQDRLEGKCNTLKLCKNPASVEISQPHLVPSEFVKTTVTMTLKVWDQFITLTLGKDIPGIKELLEPIYKADADKKTEPMKTPIGRQLKTADPCKSCAGTGLFHERLSDAANRTTQCPICEGKGKVTRGVPGCTLVKDRVHLEVE